MDARSDASALRRAVETLVADAERSRTATRRQGAEERPLGPKAQRTRAHLLATAYECFVRDGYAATTVEDIADAAGVSLGTYYQYFRDRADVLTTLVADAVLAAIDDLTTTRSDEHGMDALAGLIHRFVRGYEQTAPFQAVWEEVTHVEPPLRELRQSLSRVLEHVVASAIDGARTTVTDDDSLALARAVSAMVDRTCYLVFVVDGHRGRDVASDTAELLVRLTRRMVQG